MESLCVNSGSVVPLHLELVVVGTVGAEPTLVVGGLAVPLGWLKRGK